jgi:hypothetical protein
MLKNCPTCVSLETSERMFRHNERSRLLLQCSNCGHTFDRNHLNSNQGYAQGEYGLVNGNIPNFDRDHKLAIFLITSFLIKPGDRVLDYGAGWGGLSLRIAQISREYSLGIKVNCYEPVQRLGESIRDRDGSIVVHSDIKNCMHNDFVIAKEVIEHSNSPQVLLKALSKTMNIGAHLLITCPGHSGALEERPGNLPDYLVNNHLHFFTHKSLASLVKRTELFDMSEIALLDQYPNHASSNYRDERKTKEILHILSRRVNMETDHLQVLLRRLPT